MVVAADRGCPGDDPPVRACQVWRSAVMIGRLAEHRVAKARDQRYGPQYNFGATYYDARDEAIRRGDRTIGTEHLVLALLIDPASPAAKALGCDLDSEIGRAHVCTPVTSRAR